MMISSLVQILVFVLAVILTGLFAGAETGIYQLSRLRLRLGVEKGQRSFAILTRALRDSPGLLISTLIGTNLSVYLATSIVTYAFLNYTQSAHAAELFATLITAPVLFVFAELIPKSLFFYSSDMIMPLVAAPLFGFYKFCTWCGAIPLLRLISKFLATLTHTPMPGKTSVDTVQRHEIAAILKDTHEESFLSAMQTDIMNRLLATSHVSVRAVMTRFRNVQFVARDSDKKTLMSILEKSKYTRLPVYNGSPEHITGFINIYEVLSSDHDFANLDNFIRPIQNLPANTALVDALDIMQGQNLKIALVTGTTRLNRGKPVGVVTMKDLVEELFGELATW